MNEAPDHDDDDDLTLDALVDLARSVQSSSRPLAFHLASMTFGVTPNEPGVLADKERAALLAYAERVRCFLDDEAAHVRLAVSNDGQNQ